MSIRINAISKYKLDKFPLFYIGALSFVLAVVTYVADIRAATTGGSQPFWSSIDLGGILCLVSLVASVASLVVRQQKRSILLLLLGIILLCSAEYVRSGGDPKPIPY